MSKRNSAGPFAAGVMVQGKLDGTIIQDTLNVSSGTLINGKWYQNIDPNQGSVVLWITPEWNGNDGLTHYLLTSTNITLFKNSTGYLRSSVNDQQPSVDVNSWVAGTTYCVILRWEKKNTIDGTNYGCISINDTHTFGASGTPTAINIETGINIGTYGGVTAVNAILKGLTIYRRPLWDGSYGTDVGNGDELAQIYAAGVGKDPTEITGSFDVCLCVPTNATPGALTTGAGEAWSHPHSSNLLGDGFLLNGHYGGGPWSVGFNGTTSKIDCGSDAGLDNLADNAFTVEGWFRSISTGIDQYLMYKGAASSTGWRIRLTTTSVEAKIECDTTSPSASSSTTKIDGKWHHVAFTYDDAGDRKVRLFIDGVLVSTSVAAIGAIKPDGTYSLFISRASSYILSGNVGWVRVSNSIRYTADFIPARVPPASDANTIAQWNMVEGTGTTVDNIEGTAARDGTITAGTWQREWVDEGSPLVNDVSVVATSNAGGVDCGSEASLDDIQDGAFTIEGWFRYLPGTAGSYLYKGNRTSTGWLIYVSSGTTIRARVFCATTMASASIGGSIANDGLWHHIAVTWDDAGDRQVRLFIDGRLVNTSSAGVGAIVSDAAETCYIGHDQMNIGNAIGWVRISNNIRYTTTFTPPSRFACPANDANTVRLFAMNEGTGTTITDGSTNAQNGTLSNGTWNLSRDMAVDSPGARVYPGGMVVASDAADEGIKQTFAGLTAGSKYVIRALAYAGRTGLAMPKLLVYDETNAAIISSITAEGAQDNKVANGTFNSDTIWIKGANWTIGGNVAHKSTGAANNLSQTGVCINGVSQWFKVVYTISNYVSGTLNISIGQTTAQGTARSADGTYTEHILSGTNNSWLYFIGDATFVGDIDNVSVVAVPDEKHPKPLLFSFELPTAARGAASDCVSMSVKLLADAAGVVGWDQVELLTNLLDNPSLDTGAVADPWIPYGWTNSGLTAGESVSEASIVHSAGKSLKIAKASLHFTQQSKTLTAAKFYCFGAFTKYDSGTSIDIYPEYNSYWCKQTMKGGAARPSIQNTLNKWVGYSVAFRVDTAADGWCVGYQAVNGYVDDLYLITMDDVTLTATPASAANSVEGGGIRVDGLDTIAALSYPGRLLPNKGAFTFGYTPRHGSGTYTKLGTGEPYIFFLANGSENIRLTEVTDTTIRLSTTLGGGFLDFTYAFTAGLKYTIKIKYTGGVAQLSINGALVASIAITPFTSAPTMTLGYIADPIRIPDAVFSAP
jgi:hypothetical protein